jgi:alcohol dehydrogenase
MTTAAINPKIGTTMKSLVYHGPGQKAWEDKPYPSIKESGDAIVRITTSTICGTDLHIMKGDVPTVTDGRILGHEGIGVVEQVGSGVTEFHVGDKVIISCVTACTKCDFCIRIAELAAGFWVIPSTGPRLSTCVSHTLTEASTTFQTEATKKLS